MVNFGNEVYDEISRRTNYEKAYYLKFDNCYHLFCFQNAEHQDIQNCHCYSTALLHSVTTQKAIIWISPVVSYECDVWSLFWEKSIIVRKERLYQLLRLWSIKWDMGGWLRIINLAGCERKWLWPNFGYRHSFWLERQWKSC